MPAGRLHAIDRTRLSRQRASRHVGRQAAAGACPLRRGLPGQTPPRRRPDAGVRGASRRRQGDQGSHPRTSRFLSRTLRSQGRRSWRQGALVRRCRSGATDRAGDLPGIRRAHGHQGQVDDRRGNRHQPVPRKERHQADRDRSRRIHHPAARRTTQPYHRPGRAPVEGAGRRLVPPAPHPIRRRPCAGRTPGNARRGKGSASRRLHRCRRRHHRRQHADRRDRLDRAGDQRGQRRPHPDPAQGADRHRLDREDGADARGCGNHPAAAGPLGDGAGDVGLHDIHHRAEASGRSRRPGDVPCRAAGQRSHRDAGQRVPRDAAVHPLRRLHQPLSGLCVDRRPCLWLGLFGTDGCRARFPT